MKKFFNKLGKGLATIADWILTVSLNIILGLLLWIQITLLSFIVFLFGGMKSLNSFYRKLGDNEISSYLPFNKFVSKN